MKIRLIACGIAAILLSGVVSAAEVRLRIMETTDVHMNLLNYDYYQDKATDQYGLSKAITLIKAARAEAANSLLFDNGDLIQGSPMGDFVAILGAAAPSAFETLEKEIARGVLQQREREQDPEGGHEPDDQGRGGVEVAGAGQRRAPRSAQAAQAP